jgi:hypothetical protein
VYRDASFYEDSTPGNNGVPFGSFGEGRQQSSGFFHDQASQGVELNELHFNSQPLYIQEVDHRIE